MLRRIALALLVCASCGDENPGSTGGTDGGGGGDITGPLEIVSFTASRTEVSPGASVDLAWEVTGARVVEVSTRDSTLVSTFGNNGRVATGPMRMDSTYTLTAKRGSEMKTATIDIDVQWAPPLITDFRADPANTTINNFIALTWQTVGAEYLRLSKNGIETSRITTSVDFGQVPALIDMEETTFQLDAVNPEHTAMRSLMVRAQIPPTVVRFDIAPTILLEETTTATLTWETAGTDSTELVNGFREPVPGFPRTVSGTFRVDVPRTITHFTLVAYGGLGLAEAYRRIAPPFDEREPNNTMNTANELREYSGARGEFDRSTDVDVYLVFPTPGMSLKIWTTGVDGRGCDTDTEIVFRSFSNELARDSDDGEPTARGGRCALLDPGTDPGVGMLFEGQYFVLVSGSELGGYVLILQER